MANLRFKIALLWLPYRKSIYGMVFMGLLFCFTNSTFAQPLTDLEWELVDESIERASQWILISQRQDGSFPTVPHGQPAVTSLGVLALLAQGKMPDQGEHGAQIAAAIDFVLGTQQQSGLLAFVGPRGREISRNIPHLTGQTGSYNHAIGGLMLSEAYATAGSERSKVMQKAIEMAIKVTLAEQRRPKQRKTDQGGWRYLHRYASHDADLSIIGWQLMFLRSAKNAGFDVPKQAIDDAVTCVQAHFASNRRAFEYTVGGRSLSRAMTGAGILALAHAGLHNTPEATQAGQTMLRYSFTGYNQSSGDLDRYHYSLFQCTQAAYQMGDEYWNQFNPPMYRTLVANQNADGSWAAERSHHNDAQYGKIYTTSLVVLSLSAPNQFLPIYQR